MSESLSNDSSLINIQETSKKSIISKSKKKLIIIKKYFYQKFSNSPKYQKITELSSLLQHKYINKKIDSYVNDFIIYNYYEKPEEKKLISPEKKNYFKEKLERINKNFGNYYIYKLNKETTDKEKESQTKIKSNDDLFRTTLKSSKMNLLKDIQNNIDELNINLAFDFFPKKSTDDYSLINE